MSFGENVNNQDHNDENGPIDAVQYTTTTILNWISFEKEEH